MAVLQKTLPASCYTDQKYHDFEQRAVFLQSWFFIGTINKFKALGEVHYEIAQKSLVAKPENFGEEVKVRVYSATTVRQTPSLPLIFPDQV
jgi:hypothetical protein